jgi:hypothetical protein
MNNNNLKVDLITLQSNDGEEFEEELEDLQKLKVVSSLIEDIGFKSVIPLPNISGKDLKLFLEHYKNLEHMKQIRDREVLNCLLISANYLDYEKMQQVCCEAIAKNIKLAHEKDSENGILNWFGEKDKPTQEEIDKVLEECPWMKLDK